MQKIDYFLNGVVNGQYLEIKGNGETKEEGGYNLNFSSIIAPKGWDPGIMLMICCSNLTFYSGKLENEYLLSSRKKMTPLKLGGLVGRKGHIKDDEGNDVAELHAKGFLWEENDILYSRSIILDGFTRLNAYGGIKKINNYIEEIIPGPTSHATGITNFTIETNNGTILKGSSTYPYIFKDFSLRDRVLLSVTDLDNGFEGFELSNRKTASVKATVKEAVSMPEKASH